jgi:antitoxin component YwqK of YwqJK toxin-antitoxin module
MDNITKFNTTSKCTFHTNYEGSDKQLYHIVTRYETGQLTNITTSRDSNDVVCPYISWHSNGNRHFQYFVIDDRLHDIYRQWYKTGTLYLDKNFVNGERDGLSIEYYEDGKVKIRCNFSKGVKTGLYQEYYKTGSRKSEYYYDTLGRIMSAPYKEWEYSDTNDAQDGILVINKIHTDNTPIDFSYDIQL